MKMQMFIFIFAAIAVTNIPSLEAGSYVHDQEWFQRKTDEAYKASLKSYHHDPMEVVNHFNYHVNRYSLMHYCLHSCASLSKSLVPSSFAFFFFEIKGKSQNLSGKFLFRKTCRKS